MTNSATPAPSRPSSKWRDGIASAGSPCAPAPVRAPGLVWLGGFKSDMRGTKALALDGWAAEQGRACVRFDYSGHGESGGASPTAPSDAGWRRASRCSTGSAAGRRW